MAHILISLRKQISISIRFQIEIKFQLEMCEIVYHDPLRHPRAFIHHSFISKGSWYTMAHISISSRKQISFSTKFQLEMCAIVYHDPLRHPTCIHSSFIHSQGIMVYYDTHFRFITKTNFNFV